MARPKIEAPPADLDAEGRTAWEMALRRMKADGAWDLAMVPLLAEYAYALQGARQAREKGFHTAWDRHTRRAMAFADDLGLTPRSRHRLGVADARRETSPFDELADADGAVVDLASRRRAVNPDGRAG
jgi:hypothetical protein